MMASTFCIPAILLLLLSLVSESIQQPPGVPPRQQPHHGQPPQHQQPPQHYQEQPQQHQQPPQQHQEQPQQHQQPPQQHQEQPQEHQQPPQQHQQHQQQSAEGHGHGQSHQPGERGHHGKPLEFASEFHNRDHIVEHLQKVVATKPKDQMTAEELEFHYFKMHDYDNNNQLDGLEIAKAMTHVHIDHNSTASNAQENSPVISDDELASTVDGILNTFDHDKDGCVTYFEFKTVSQVSGNGSTDGA